jgi:prevent-host-death family protein
MQRIGSREFKNRLGRYLQAVRRGETLIITDRDRPVAKVCPPDKESSEREELESRLRELESKGLIRRATGPISKFKPVPSKGKLASRMLLEDRR